ncbi:hypothetical protein N0V82_001123 [Gnomoniopsis sp. IMI 355080]|nr:hypothetical protein N0V82_001123 [Gnomoniopsis sp. IMI 355080]
MSIVPPGESFVRVPLSEERPGRAAYRGMRRINGRSSEIDQWDVAFIDRKSAQVFALSLLKLPWSQNNYVVGRRASTILVRNLLTQAAPSSIRFIRRLKQNPSALGLGQSDLANVLAATDKLLQHDLDVRHLCELDDVLNSVQHPLGEVSLMVGVLLLTNVEYRELIYQSMRHVSATKLNQQDTETVLELDKGHVIVVGAFGVKFTFVVDLSALLDHLPGHQRTHQVNIRVKFDAVLLAAFKAYLRSFMFTRCIDGADIEEAMSYEGDVYHIS